MPQETKTHGHEHRILEGTAFRPHNREELVAAIDEAFDYRGDVTIETKDSRTIEGFIFNRESNVAEPFIQLFPKNLPGELVIHYTEIVSIAFSGEDTAFGKSWEAWIKKNTDQRIAEAARLAADAAARGHL